MYSKTASNLLILPRVPETSLSMLFTPPASTSAEKSPRKPPPAFALRCLVALRFKSFAGVDEAVRDLVVQLCDLARGNASPEDSAKTYTKASEVLQAARSGGDFRALALENSQDPSVKQNNGDLYYFTAGQMVGAFEDAAFALKPGEIISAPVRTQFGLHIIKVTDRKPAPGEIRASHS